MSKISREKDFHDTSFGQGTRLKVRKYYSLTESSTKFYEGYLKRYGKDKTVVDCGCGTGYYTTMLAECSARVIGVDLSIVALQQARQGLPKAERVDGRICFSVADAENLPLSKNTIDMICGKSILHHLEVPRALSEIARVLKPNGEAIFYEPLGHNPVLNLFRKLTPHLRTVDEHPLLVEDLTVSERYFELNEVHYFHLCALAAILFKKSFLFNPVLTLLDKIDQWIFNTFPFLRKHAWVAVIILSHPKQK